MTTKYKIIAGFIVVLGLLGIQSGFGYFSLQRASHMFDEYDRLARLNALMSDVVAEVYESAYNLEHFLKSNQPESMGNAIASINNARTYTAEALPYIRAEQRRKDMQEADRMLVEYVKNLESVQANMQEYRKQYSEQIVPLLQTLHKVADTFNTGAKVTGNIELYYRLGEVWQVISGLNASLTAYGRDASAETARDAEISLDKALSVATAFGDIMYSAKAKEDYAVFIAAFHKMDEVFKAQHGYYLAGMRDVEKTNEHDAAILALAEAINSEVNAEMLTMSAQTLADNESAQNRTLLVSGAGVLLGLLIAAGIIIGLIRILGRVSAFAGAVSQGNFSYDPGITEKGEIGSMVTALHQIPAILTSVVSQCGEMVTSIAGGRFRERIDGECMEGEFCTLLSTVNSVADTYTKIIDDLPIIVFTADPERNIQYLNNEGRKAAGQTGLIGTFCGDMMKTSACDSKESCAGTSCIRNHDKVHGELTAYPNGKRMEISFISSPIVDMKGNATGFINVINDITTIKDQQTTIQNVAREASEVAVRVASASEELAAQVEQISRGAELQREELVSTAGAMTEMNSTVIEVARNAGQASEQSESTKRKAEEGAGLVNKVVLAVNQVNSVARNLSENMHGLGKLAENIGGVMNVITDIADQTNLLALNAAIEAARAGEVGRGFAVVADEVRKLAEKSMVATQEVGESITAIQQSARENIEYVEGAVASVTQATELANSSGQALAEIVNLASSNSMVVTSIATAAEEQSATSEEISRALEHVNHVVGETTEGMVQSSMAVQDLAALAQQLRTTMEGLR